MMLWLFCRFAFTGEKHVFVGFSSFSSKYARSVLIVTYIFGCAKSVVDEVENKWRGEKLRVLSLRNRAVI